MNLQGKRVFITGITSPLGGELALQLIEAGARVTGLVRNKNRSSHPPANIEIVAGDCENPNEYREHVQACSFVIHAAGLHLASEIIRACAGHDRLERIIFIGSMRVRYPDHLLSRTEAAGKRVLLEKEDEISAGLLPWTILRPTLIYASGDRSFSKVRRFMAARHVFPLPGNGEAARQPISAQDLAVSTIQTLQSPHALRKEYDLPGEKISVREILEIMAEEMGLSVKLIRVPEPPVKMLRRICDIFAFDGYGAVLISFLRWYHGFDWPGDAAAVDFGHRPRSFRQNVREQIANEGLAREGVR